jgi:hypothetical protein
MRYEGEQDFEIHRRIYPSFNGEFVINYIATKSFQMYGLLGLGFAIASYPDVDIKNIPILSFHFTPLGLRFGKNIGGFCEIGYGYRGIVNAGLSVRF